MLDELKRNVTSYQPSSGPFFCAIVAFSVTTALILALTQALWSMPSIRCIGMQEGDYSFNGKMELGSTCVHYELEYNIPAGSLESVSIRGPLKRGVAAGHAEFALTLCGGEQTCHTVETITCSKEKLGPACGRLAGTIKSLDPVTPDPGDRIHHTLTAIAEHTNRYVVVIEANGQIFSEFIGPICLKSISLPSVV